MKIEKTTGFRTDRKEFKNKDSDLVKVDIEIFKTNCVKYKKEENFKMGTENWMKADRKILKAKALEKDNKNLKIRLG